MRATRNMGRVVLKAEDGVPVYLRAVAKGVEAPAARFGAVTRDGEEVVLGMALSRIGENAKDVVDAVKEKVATVVDALPDGVTLKPLSDRPELAEKAVSTAARAPLTGYLLVAIVRFIFLGYIRSTLVVISALLVA